MVYVNYLIKLLYSLFKRIHLCSSNLLGSNTAVLSFFSFCTVLIGSSFFCPQVLFSQTNAISRDSILITNNWDTWLVDSSVKDQRDISSFFTWSSGDGSGKQTVNLPHQWDQYGGLRRKRHGNLHGTAWYRKTVEVPKNWKEGRYFLYFAGVGSYAEVLVNGQPLGDHAGGRTGFWLELPKGIAHSFLLEVKVRHPEGIRDLPWVCGGCHEEIGFSEGSQPFGIFREVFLVRSPFLSVQPFGIYLPYRLSEDYNQLLLSVETSIDLHPSGSGVPAAGITLHHDTLGEQMNRSALWTKHLKSVQLQHRLLDPLGNLVVETSISLTAEQLRRLIDSNQLMVRAAFPEIQKPKLWSPAQPNLYTVKTSILVEGRVLDEVVQRTGFRSIRWPDLKKGGPLLVNGVPFFIHGTAAYEHRMGGSHAFEKEEVQARVHQLIEVGFNAFRDAHQPLHLQFQEEWQSRGILWWPQFAAHIWFDDPGFKKQFKVLLREWIKERRNNPAVVLWGLENESTLPADFAQECVEIIREMDVLSAQERLVTTCNGGSGTDWDVPQNWTGTYGGDPNTYADDLKKQILVGEYGAWRSVGLHQNPPFTLVQTKKGYPEEHHNQLLAIKLREAWRVQKLVAGHFHWLFYSHENPGRSQSGEGFDGNLRIGPVNYKGLYTLWGEPTDALYLFKSFYTQPEEKPMVYIVSHTWGDRVYRAGDTTSITVYSNAQEVRLYAGEKKKLLAMQKRSAQDPFHIFQFTGIPLTDALLIAEAVHKNKAVATDKIWLHHLPRRSMLKTSEKQKKDSLLQPEKGHHYLYRVNAGGPECIDQFGAVWQADQTWEKSSISFGSLSWGNFWPEVPETFASSRYRNSAVENVWTQTLFQHQRFGRNQLVYQFVVPKGKIRVELYFNESWHQQIEASGYRLFDIAFNQKIVVKNLDIWTEAGGSNKVLKKIFEVETDGLLNISFPKVAAGQVLLSAIAIAVPHKLPLENGSDLPNQITDQPILNKAKNNSKGSWLQTGVLTTAGSFFYLPSYLYGADWIIEESQQKEQQKEKQKEQKKENKKVSKNDHFKALLQEQSNSIKESVDHSTHLKDQNNNSMQDSILLSYHGVPVVYYLIEDSGQSGKRLFEGNTSQNQFQYWRATRDGSNTCFYFRKEKSQMNPGFDWKITQTFQPTQIEHHGKNWRMDSVNGKRGLKWINGKEQPQELKYKFSVGVGDYYALRIRYVNQSNQNYSATLSLVSSDGLVLHREQVVFPPYLVNKWGILYWSSGTQINAGNYYVLLQMEETTTKPEEIFALGAMEVQ